MKKLLAPFVRLFTRVSPEQKDDIEKKSNQLNCTEGDIVRKSLDLYISKNKLK